MVGGPQFGYGSLPGAADGGCCGSDEDGGGGPKFSRVDDGGGALPGPDADNALDGRPSTQTNKQPTFTNTVIVAFNF